MDNNEIIEQEKNEIAKQETVKTNKEIESDIILEEIIT